MSIMRSQEVLLMAMIKVVNNAYYDYDTDVQNVLNYVLTSKDVVGNYISSHLVYNIGIPSVVQQMKLTATQLGKNKGRVIQHLIISFDDYYESFVDDSFAYEIVSRFMRSAFGSFQWIFGIHRNSKGNLHAHAIINNVNLQTGKKINTYNDTMEILCQELLFASLGNLKKCFHSYG